MSSTRLEQLMAERDALVRSILSAGADTSTATCLANDSVTPAQTKAALDSARSARIERIRLLGRYNEVKDVAQGLIGLVADMRACRVLDVMRDLEIEDDD